MGVQRGALLWWDTRAVALKNPFNAVALGGGFFDDTKSIQTAYLLLVVTYPLCYI